MEAETARAKELRAAAKRALQRHQWGRARDALDEALELAPDLAALYRLRIIASAGLGDFESALEDAEALLELQPSPDAHMYKGHALYHLRDFSAAARAFQAGLEASPRDKLMQQGFWDALNMLRQEQPQQQHHQQQPQQPQQPQRGGPSGAQGARRAAAGAGVRRGAGEAEYGFAGGSEGPAGGGGGSGGAAQLLSLYEDQE